MLSPAWKPGWAIQNREPSFMTGDSAPTMTSFGRWQYVWGNVTAIDCLNVARNEGSAAVDMDFNLCFAGECMLLNSNLIRTSVVVDQLMFLDYEYSS